jgi:hypothetical protein
MHSTCVAPAGQMENKRYKKSENDFMELYKTRTIQNEIQIRFIHRMWFEMHMWFEMRIEIQSEEISKSRTQPSFTRLTKEQGEERKKLRQWQKFVIAKVHEMTKPTEKHGFSQVQSNRISLAIQIASSNQDPVHQWMNSMDRQDTCSYCRYLSYHTNYKQAPKRLLFAVQEICLWLEIPEE